MDKEQLISIIGTLPINVIVRVNIDYQICEKNGTINPVIHSISYENDD